jgi:hypothetical protein
MGGKASEFGDDPGVRAGPPTVQEGPSVAGATTVSDNHDARCGGPVQIEHPPWQETAGWEESAQASSPVPRNQALNSQPPSRGKAILIVDDEPEVAEVLVEIFSDCHALTRKLL